MLPQVNSIGGEMSVLPLRSFFCYSICMKIVEYKTATAESCTALDKEVNKMLSQGYQLYGPPYVREKSIAQAMVKCGLRENMAPLETIPETLIAP